MRFLLRDLDELIAFCAELGDNLHLNSACSADGRQPPQPVTPRLLGEILRVADELLGASPDTWFVVSKDKARGSELASRSLELAVLAVERGDQTDGLLIPYNDGGVIVVCSDASGLVRLSAMDASWWQP